MHLPIGRKCFHLANPVGCNHLSSTVHRQSLLLPRHAFTMSSSKRPRPAAADDNDPSISPPPVKRKVQSTVTSRRTDSPRITLMAIDFV